MGNLDAKFNAEIFRKDHLMILATQRHLATMLPIRVQYSAAKIKAGTVMARQTSGSLSGTHTAYDDNAASGINTAACVLFQEINPEDFKDSSDTVLAQGIFGGQVYESMLTGLDANGKTDLGARSLVGASGTSILSF